MAGPGWIENMRLVVVHKEGAGGDEYGLQAEEDEAAKSHFFLVICKGEMLVIRRSNWGEVMRLNEEKLICRFM